MSDAVSGNGQSPLILASASEARRTMLSRAGVSFTVQPSGVDEIAVRDALNVDGGIAPDDMADVLARTKAQTVSEAHPGAYVIGADQVLAMGDRIFEKADTAEKARAQLLSLRGQTHALHTAVVLARGGAVTWSVVDVARVTLREFTPVFLGQYMAMAGDAMFRSVGGYELEGPGSQLVEKVSGDYFTVLGLPLLVLLEELRQVGVLVR